AALNKAAERFDAKCFALLPHVDSSKGAWKELEGTSSAQLFTHPLVLPAVWMKEYRAQNTFHTLQLQAPLGFNEVEAKGVCPGPKLDKLGLRTRELQCEGPLHLVSNLLELPYILGKSLKLDGAGY